MLGIIRIKRSVDDQLHAYNITAYVVGQAKSNHSHIFVLGLKQLNYIPKSKTKRNNWLTT